MYLEVEVPCESLGKGSLLDQPKELSPLRQLHHIIRLILATSSGLPQHSIDLHLVDLDDVLVG